MADEKVKDPRYPGKRYNAKGESCYVQDAAADEALGPGWFDSPKKAVAPAPKKAKPEKE